MAGFFLPKREGESAQVDAVWEDTAGLLFQPKAGIISLGSLSKQQDEQP